MFGLKVLKIAWPFIKEMIIGKNSLRYAIRKNRVKVVFFFCVILSFAMNWILVPRMITISAEYINLEKELKASRETIVAFKDEKESMDAVNDELVVLRARVKELESVPVVVKVTTPAKTVKPTKRDVDYVSSRLNSLGK